MDLLHYYYRGAKIWTWTDTGSVCTRGRNRLLGGLRKESLQFIRITFRRKLTVLFPSLYSQLVLLRNTWSKLGFGQPPSFSIFYILLTKIWSLQCCWKPHWFMESWMSSQAFGKLHYLGHSGSPESIWRKQAGRKANRSPQACSLFSLGEFCSYSNYTFLMGTLIII